MTLRNILRVFLGAEIKLSGILSAGVTLFCLATLAGFLGRAWWPFELATHFRVQYFVFLAVSAVVLAAFGRFFVAVVAFAFALPNVLVIIPLYMTDRSKTGGGVPVKAVLMNVHSSNKDHAAAVRFILGRDPDIFIVEELTEEWSTTLRRQLQLYPYVISRPREDNFGIGLFSKMPLESGEIIDLGDLGLPAVKASLRPQGKRLLILGIHAPPPVGRELREERTRQVKELAKLVSGEERVAVFGDLNLTPWSPIFRDLLTQSGLRDSRDGFGIQPTWPSDLPYLLIPIDHCLVSKNLVIRDCAVGPNIGSDHYPLMVELALH